MPRVLNKILVISVIFSLLLQPVAPVLAEPVNVQTTDLKNSLETVGTKVNRLKTVGSSGVDESSGAFTYSYPFAVPKGKFGLEPSLSISYNSQSTENDWVGYGMSLTVPFIERVSKHGTDKLYTEKNFVSSIGGELIAKPNSNTDYLQKYDDGSYQLYRFDESKQVWTLTDRSGNVYTYGQTLDSRIFDETIPIHVAKYYLNSI